MNIQATSRTGITAAPWWKITAAVVVAVAAALTTAACGGDGPAKPSVAACTKAYPAWFAASAAAQTTTATPAGCKGLPADQLTKIATDYLASQS